MVLKRVLPGLVLLIAGFYCGIIIHHQDLRPFDLGGSADRAVVQEPSSDIDRSTTWLFQEQATKSFGLMSRLDALGYLQGYNAASARSGVVVHDPERAQPGLNFYVSGHAPEARLMTMAGEVVHTWKRAFADACPHAEPVGVAPLYWRRARLLPGGDVLAIFDYHALIRVNRASEIVWKRCEPYHHDLFVDDDGYITVLRRRVRDLSQGDVIKPILDDEIEVLDPQGRTVSRLSIMDALAASSYAPLLDRIDVDGTEGDILHTNAIKVLDGRLSSRAASFGAGNFLISIRNLDTLAIIETERKAVTWALTGMFRQQHDPVLLETGGMLVFDNLGHLGKSQVVEIDPLSQKVLWSYRGEPGVGFVSPCCGSNQRLANGNTLITDTYNGRAVEVTRAGDTVWEFRSPHRAGNDGELVAVLMDMIRLEHASDSDWLPHAHGEQKREEASHSDAGRPRGR